MTKSAAKIVVLYSLFAALSTLAKNGSQIVSMFIYSGIHAIEISIFIETIAGLPPRYILEKFIFSFQSKSLKHDGQLFILYSFMGIFTTIIFWVTEYAFHLLFLTDLMRYFSVILGLMIGYYIMYQLDKRFVFVQKIPRTVAT